MWSQILAEILDCEWTNLSQMGAGNEAIAGLVLDQLSVTNDCSSTLWITQWTIPYRLDLEDSDRYTVQISKDPVYYKNFIETALGKKYWCSSASEINLVQQHNHLIGIPQSQARGRMYQLAVARALEAKQVSWKFCLTYPAPWREQTFIDPGQWMLPSLNEFRYASLYTPLDVGQVQPVSSIHLDWLAQTILPHCEYDQSRFDAVRDKYTALDQNRLLDFKQRQSV